MSTMHDDVSSDAGSFCDEPQMRWIQWFLSLPGNQMLCRVDLAYIEDRFNLFGLNKEVPRFMEALNLVSTGRIGRGESGLSDGGDDDASYSGKWPQTRTSVHDN
jgi:hypothetical protein